HAIGLARDELAPLDEDSPVERLELPRPPPPPPRPPPPCQCLACEQLRHVVSVMRPEDRIGPFASSRPDVSYGPPDTVIESRATPGAEFHHQDNVRRILFLKRKPKRCRSEPFRPGHLARRVEAWRLTRGL